MAEKKLPSQTIVLKGLISNRPEEILEIKDVQGETVLQFQSATGEVSQETLPGDLMNALTGTEYLNVAETIDTSPADGTGDTYIFNQDTGEFQLINLNGATTINSSEVEIVTVDGSSLLTHFEGASSNFQVLGSRARSRSPQQWAMAGTHREAGSASEVIVSSALRVKSAPALLRNSRRLPNTGALTASEYATVSVAPGELPSNQNKAATTRRKPPTSTPRSAIKREPRESFVSSVGRGNRQLVLLEEGSPGIGQISHILESYPHSGVEHTGDGRSGYIVYQNIGDEQHVAELFAEVDPADNIIYQLDDNNALSFNDISSAGPVAVKARKRKKASPQKKPPKKAVSSKHEGDGKKANRGGGASELKCLEIGCPTVTCNVAELRKHLTSYHDMSFDLEVKDFLSDTAFREWRVHYERDRMVSFIYRGGTKKISKTQSVAYMICHRSGHYKPTMTDTAKRKRKMKPQGSCKIGGYCTAGIKLLKNLETGGIQAHICHTHYGHPLDSEAIPHLRVNPVLKKLIIKKFEEGLTFPDMLAYIHHNPDGLEGLRVVDRRAIRNIFETWKKTPSSNQGVLLPVSGEVIIPSQLNDPKAGYMVPEQNIPAVSEEVLAGSFGSPQEAEGDEASQFPSTEVTTSSEESVASEAYREEENAPVLCSINDVKDDSSQPGDKEEGDEEPPLLIAIESVKSLRVEQKATGNTAKCLKRQALTAKGGRMKRIGRRVKIPVIVKTESMARNAGHPAKCKKLTAFNRRARYQKPKVVVQRLQKIRRRRKTSRMKLTKAKLTLTGKVKDSEKITLPPITNYEVPSAPETSLPTRAIVEEDSDPLRIYISNELEATIDKLHHHGEAGPSVLLYKRFGETNTKYGGFCRAFKEDDFCLIIQTPVQRQIFQLFPSTVSIEILENPKPSDHGLKLAFLSVLDDYREAIPVAWMIADAMCPRYLNQFCRMLRYHCGELPVLHIMAPRNMELFKIWTTHFAHKPKMLQSEFSVKRDLRVLLNRHFPNDEGRTEAWTVIENLVEEKRVEKLSLLQANLHKLSKKCASGSVYWKKMEKDWFSRISEWGFAYRVGAAANLLFAAEGFVKLRKFVSFKGTKRLNQNIDHILKIGYDKCFLRTKRMFKGDQKLSNLLEKVQETHQVAGSELSDSNITIFPDFPQCNIEAPRGVRNEVMHLNSPCNCKIRCRTCNICMHEYVCTCEYFLKQKSICPHIHKIHCIRNGIPLEDSDKEEPVPAQADGKSESKPGVTEMSFELRPVSEVCGSESEITIINENDMEQLNITEVLGLLGQHEGQEMPKIVSITDADTQQIIFDGAVTSPLTIFQLDSE